VKVAGAPDPAAESPEKSVASSGNRPYRPASATANVLISCQIFTVVCVGLLILTPFLIMALPDWAVRRPAGGWVIIGLVLGLPVLEVVSRVAVICLLIGLALWLHAVCQNLPSLGARQLRVGPAWAVLSLFVPGVNVVVPFVALIEVWKASDPTVGVTDRASRGALATSGDILAWWVVFAAGVLPLVGLPWILEASSHWETVLSPQEDLLLWQLLMAICGSVPMVRAIRGIERRQRQKAELFWGQVHRASDV